MPPDVDETPLKAELPRAYCRRISLLKAQTIAADPSDIILCGDTTVALQPWRLGGGSWESRQTAQKQTGFYPHFLGAATA